MMTLPGWSQTIPNPSFEDAAVPAGASFLDPKTPGYSELIPELKWAFGMPCGICLQGTAYAEQILEVLGAEPQLANRALANHPELAGYAPKPHYRPLTKFENRGIRLGHGVWDLVFERV